MYIALVSCPLKVICTVVPWVEVDMVYHRIHIRVAIRYKGFCYQPMDISLTTASVFQIHIQISVVIDLWLQKTSGNSHNSSEVAHSVVFLMTRNGLENL